MDDQNPVIRAYITVLSHHERRNTGAVRSDFFGNPGGICCSCRTERLRKEHDPELDFRSLKPEAGTLLSRGRPITEADLHIGYMLQRDHLFEWRTIYSNVLLGLEISRTLTPERKEKVGEMMETYGLKSFSNARPSELSGGMRQRAALIRTLAMEPDLLLLDEPFSARLPDEAERL